MGEPEKKKKQPSPYKCPSESASNLPDQTIRVGLDGISQWRVVKRSDGRHQWYRLAKAAAALIKHDKGAAVLIKRDKPNNKAVGAALEKTIGVALENHMEIEIDMDKPQSPPSPPPPITYQFSWSENLPKHIISPWNVMDLRDD